MNEASKSPNDKTPRTEKSNMDQPQEEFIEPTGAHVVKSAGDQPDKIQGGDSEPGAEG